MNQSIINVTNNGSWLVAHGSRLMTQASKLMAKKKAQAHGSQPTPDSPHAQSGGRPQTALSLRSTSPRPEVARQDGWSTNPLPSSEAKRGATADANLHHVPT